MKRKQYKGWKATAVAKSAAWCSAMVLTALPGVSQALDFGGYFRVGPGATSNSASRACYGLSGPGLKYRLGNECDIYGEFKFSQDYKKDDIEYRAVLMPSIYNAATDSGNASFNLAQMYAEGKGFDVAPDATFWVGKRFYGRADVHIVDTFFVKMDGVGGGAYGIPAGPGKLGLAYFRDDGAVNSNRSGTRFNADLSDLPVNPGGKLRFVGTAVNADFAGGSNGFGLTAQHDQADFLIAGMKNTLWLQTAKGSAGLDANFGSLSAASGDKSWRIVESINWQKGRFGGQALALWQTDRLAAGKTDSTSFGGRVSYGVTKNFKMVAELGRSQKRPEGGATQKLTKFTLAPTLSTGPDFWSRPELRFYVTKARWNQAANAAAGVNGLTGVPANAGKTSGTSFGVQAEMWF